MSQVEDQDAGIAAAQETPSETQDGKTSEEAGEAASRPASPQRREQARDRRPPPAARNLLRETQRQVRQIIEDLQQALEEMESVQRLLEQVERERREDLQELESLRRSLDVLRSHRTSPRLSHPRPHPSAPAGRSVDDTGSES